MQEMLGLNNKSLTLSGISSGVLYSPVFKYTVVVWEIEDNDALIFWKWILILDLQKRKE